MTTIKTSPLRYVSCIPPEPHQRMFLPPLEIGAELWMHHSRRSSLGGYVGTFSLTWRDGGYVGPKGQRFTMLTEYTTDSAKAKGGEV